MKYLDYLYVSIINDLEDRIIFLTEEQAIQASIRKPNTRVEVFEKAFDLNGDFNGYISTHSYYKNGVLYSK